LAIKNITIIYIQIGDEKSAQDEDKDKSTQRKSKYYAPVYVVRDRVAGNTPNLTSTTDARKKEISKSSGSREKRASVKDNRAKERKEKVPRQVNSLSSAIL
jgi:hypothetical protein